MGRDPPGAVVVRTSYVSIHAPHVGRDHGFADIEGPFHGFNPRAPRGARPMMATQQSLMAMFQSTRPTWGATKRRAHHAGCGNVSIHAPHVGRDADRGQLYLQGTVSTPAPHVGRVD